MFKVFAVSLFVLLLAVACGHEEDISHFYPAVTQPSSPVAARPVVAPVLESRRAPSSAAHFLVGNMRYEFGPGDVTRCELHNFTHLRSGTLNVIFRREGEAPALLDFSFEQLHLGQGRHSLVDSSGGGLQVETGPTQGDTYVTSSIPGAPRSSCDCQYHMENQYLVAHFQCRDLYQQSTFLERFSVEGEFKCLLDDRRRAVRPPG